ncbi:DEAD/DEAH box helicase family protein [Salinimicrobium gaetbulicola]|uniref:DEAD/DEAH box helicase family protein n=1 Tax=Salinimicrobium gaetbulicola TaxID=999702 RepID=A0ABW3IGT8_9FLAO
MAAFHNKTVLAKYLLTQFNVLGFEALAKDLKSSHLEGYNEEGNTKYLHALQNRLYDNEKLTKEILQEYDENIVRFTHEISHHRTEVIKWKYFQYLSLLFTEIFLDKYFSNPAKLLNELNLFVEDFNNRLDENFRKLNPNSFVVEKFTESDLNKIAFWNATGSGKTLLMHVNIKQYLHYAKKQQHEFNKVILITPNEGLSQQHLEEFKLSDMDAGIFSKDSTGMFSGDEIEVIEITKLAEESGDKTVAVDAFETNNLVLIDEGHRGSGGDKWKMFRDRLSETGFAFEYSATFGQAISAASGKNKKELEQEYAKSIIFDYSYKFFYGDGYGKEYKILNLDKDDNKNYVRKYLTANLLSFYQQVLIFEQNKNLAHRFLLHKPLWIFVGGRVNAVRKEGGVDTSDVLDIIYFLTNFIKDKNKAVQDINDVLNNNAGLLDDKGNSIFHDSFAYLVGGKTTANDIYLDLLKKVFNSEVPGANLYLDNLKGVDGELGLRVGEADYFAVINVGDETKLFNLAQDNKVPGNDKEFSESLFHGINEEESSINLLIGSKKFTEGWSSWRVSSMGLMNIGKSEGSQIIQLFGRGVRLKGYEFSLKRTGGLDDYQRPDKLKELRKILNPLETLNIFGVRADYMQKFKEFLEEEGLPSNDSSWHTVKVPSIVNTEMLRNNLKLIQVKEGEDFKKKRKLQLKLDKVIYDNSLIELDWYPKIQVLVDRKINTEMTARKDEGTLVEHNLAFINWNNVFFEIERFKFEKHWYNLSLSIDDLKAISYSKDWYKIFIPHSELELRSFEQVRIWEELVIALLKKYIEKFYNYNKNLFNSQHIETRILESTDDNLMYEYEIKMNSEENLDTIQIRIEELIESIKDNSFNGQQQLGTEFYAFNNEHHIYTPLLSMDVSTYRQKLKISPIALDASEKLFADDLVKYYRANHEKFDKQQVFLLRNQSKKGIGFFVDTNNFYPDFILWIKEGDRQHIAFIDPKGIRNSKSINDPKIQFHKYLKEKIQPQVESEDIILNSFIVSNTRLFEVNWKGDLEREDFHKHNVYFQEEDNTTYIGEILKKVLI